jgi:hypothetical protein
MFDRAIQAVWRSIRYATRWRNIRAFCRDANDPQHDRLWNPGELQLDIERREHGRLHD